MDITSTINGILNTNQGKKPNFRPIIVRGGTAPYDGDTPDQGHSLAGNPEAQKEFSRAMNSLISRGLTDPKALKEAMLKTFKLLKANGVISGDARSLDVLEKQFTNQIQNSPSALGKLGNLFQQVSSNVAQQPEPSKPESQKRRELSSWLARPESQPSNNEQAQFRLAA